ncbi:Nn.00g070670.m01.CDS01 [Neocucurbitaria sp. VM-36]
MSLKDQIVLITGASMGIGAAIARRLAAESATLILIARSSDKLKAVAEDLKKLNESVKVFTTVVDVQGHTALSTAVSNIVKEVGHIDILINNAGLALGAPNTFPDLKVQDIITMTGTNINGFMFATYAVLNEGKMKERGKGLKRISGLSHMLTPSLGTILNVTSTTGLEVPPFPGEAVYHASKACQEAFTNVLRTELVRTDIKVLALRPGVVATNFHEQRVGYDTSQYNEFMEGFEPLVAEDVAEAAVFMLCQKDRVSVKALDVVPTAQRSLQVFDREWNGRGEGRNTKQ